MIADHLKREMGQTKVDVEIHGNPKKLGLRNRFCLFDAPPSTTERAVGDYFIWKYLATPREVAPITSKYISPVEIHNGFRAEESDRRGAKSCKPLTLL